MSALAREHSLGSIPIVRDRSTAVKTVEIRPRIENGTLGGATDLWPSETVPETIGTARRLRCRSFRGLWATGIAIDETARTVCRVFCSVFERAGQPGQNARRRQRRAAQVRGTTQVELQSVADVFVRMGSDGFDRQVLAIIGFVDNARVHSVPCFQIASPGDC